ncbi:MAG: DHH family phosphoesterase [Spirochaetales bacterium]|nr:DHH family phosphoesterase [Spirochaetales bacterium]
MFIQTHNFPDHDSVASAFGLQYLLKQRGITSFLIYEGTVQRDSLRQLIEHLKIPIAHAGTHHITEKDKIIIVDGCKGNKNVTDLVGDEVAVIDHHEVTSPDDVRFSDIRPHYGACSTIIYEYFTGLRIVPPVPIGTALLAGLLMDTALMSRGVSEEDLAAYSGLYPASNIGFVNSNLRNYIQTKDLEFFEKAIKNSRIQESFAFCYFDEGCNQNLLGIIGDFFLALREVDLVFLCADNEVQINFSLRSEAPCWNAALIIQEVLRGIGFGGGHADMAGGIVKDIALFNPEDIFVKLGRVLRESKAAV